MLNIAPFFILLIESWKYPLLILLIELLLSSNEQQHLQPMGLGLGTTATEWKLIEVQFALETKVSKFVEFRGVDGAGRLASVKYLLRMDSPLKWHDTFRWSNNLHGTFLLNSRALLVPLPFPPPPPPPGGDFCTPVTFWSFKRVEWPIRPERGFCLSESAQPWSRLNQMSRTTCSLPKRTTPLLHHLCSKTFASTASFLQNVCFNSIFPAARLAPRKRSHRNGGPDSPISRHSVRRLYTVAFSNGVQSCLLTSTPRLPLLSSNACSLWHIINSRISERTLA